MLNSHKFIVRNKVRQVLADQKNGVLSHLCNSVFSISPSLKAVAPLCEGSMSTYTIG